MLHPHELEHIEFMNGTLAGTVEYDRREAQMGAAWNDNWQDEWLLTDRDVWVSNPGYHGPKGFHPEEEIDHVSAEEWKAYQEAYTAYFVNESLWMARLEDVESGRDPIFNRGVRS